MKSSFSVGILLLAAAVSCGAQGMRAGRNAAKPNHPAAKLDPSTIQVITGDVTAVNIAYGAQYPSIVVNGVTIKLAPVWYLLENDFEVTTGQNVTVTAAPCTQQTDLYALKIVNNTTSAAIELRDESGTPLWSSRRAGGGKATLTATAVTQQGAAARGGSIDPSTVQTATGVVDSVNAGVGIQMPTLTLKTSDGQTITMKIGPERILLENDFELKPGDTVTAKYALVTCTNEYVALELTKDGVTVVLRTL